VSLDRLLRIKRQKVGRKTGALSLELFSNNCFLQIKAALFERLFLC
jgi:hypothetical protein